MIFGNCGKQTDENAGICEHCDIDMAKTRGRLTSKVFLSAIIIGSFSLASKTLALSPPPPNPQECVVYDENILARIKKRVVIKIDSVKDDYAANHQGFRESLIKNISGEITKIKETSRGYVGGACLDLIGYYIYTKLPDINPEKENCKRNGGSWFPNIVGEYQCSLPTTDAGEVCTKDSECQGACLGDNKLSSDQHPSTGECSEWTIVLGCHYYFLEDGHRGEICMD